MEQMTLIGKNYKIVREIGKGEFGKVYLCTHSQFNQVAIKLIQKSKIKSPKCRQLFETQKTILKILNSQHVIKLYQPFQDKKFHYLVTQYCNQGDLYNYIKKKKFLQEEQALILFKQILKGFKDLRLKNILHRDIKLKNILVHNSKIKIADFGLSKINEYGETQVGTPYTKAPEVFRRKRYDSRADIWSLGVIFYQMLFRMNYPFNATSQKQLFEKIETKQLKLSYDDIKISKECKILLKRMLTVDVQKRITWKQIFQHPLINIDLPIINQIDDIAQNLHFKQSNIKIIKDTIETAELIKEYKIGDSKHPILKRINLFYLKYILYKKILFFSQEETKLIREKNSLNNNLDITQSQLQQSSIKHQIYVKQFKQALYNLKKYLKIVKDKQLQKQKVYKELKELFDIQQDLKNLIINQAIEKNILLNYFMMIEQIFEKIKITTVKQLLNKHRFQISYLLSKSQFDFDQANPQAYQKQTDKLRNKLI